MTYKNFGRIQSPFDSRDYRLSNFIRKGIFGVSLIKEKNWEFPSIALDQGKTPHCVGFSMADFGINYPVKTDYVNEDGHNFYYICKEIEGKPLEETGTTMRCAAKALRQIGRIDRYAFAANIDEIKYWVLNKSPMIVGTIWTEKMSFPNENNIISVEGEIVGGHAYLINEWREDGYIGIQNSWGKDWGINGKAYISVVDFEKIFSYDGEAVTAVELENKIDTETKKCWLLSFFSK